MASVAALAIRKDRALKRIMAVLENAEVELDVATSRDPAIAQVQILENIAAAIESALPALIAASEPPEPEESAPEEKSPAPKRKGGR